MKDEVTTMFNREESSETNVVTNSVENRRANSLANIRPIPFTKDYQPANPGRPKGARNLSSILRDLLNENATDIDYEYTELQQYCKGKRSITNGDVIAFQLTHKAKKGDLQAIKEFADRTEGKVAQRLEVEQTNQNSPVIEKLQQLSAIYAQALDDHTAKIKALEALSNGADEALLAEIDAVEGEFLGI